MAYSPFLDKSEDSAVRPSCQPLGALSLWPAACTLGQWSGDPGPLALWLHCRLGER